MENPYLSGSFAPVGQETESAPLDVIAGAVPRDLDGVLVRNGPDPRHPPRRHAVTASAVGWVKRSADPTPALATAVGKTPNYSCPMPMGSFGMSPEPQSAS